MLSDQPLIERMVAAGGDATFSQLAAEIVTSKQFRNRLGREDRLRQSKRSSSNGGRCTMKTCEQKSRRHFLRGAGVALALPWMESLPSWRRTRRPRRLPNKPPLRFACIYFSNGVDPDPLVGERRGRGHGIRSRRRSRSRPIREDIVFVRGSTTSRPSSHQPAPGPHGTCSPARTVSLDPSDIRVGTTMDQVLAQQIGDQTAVPSLALGIEPNELRLEDGLSMIYGSSISWASPTKPATKEIYPARTFDQLVGDGKGRKLDRSILDAVLEETHDLQPKISTRRPQEARRISGIGARHREAHRPRRQAGAPRRLAAHSDNSPTCRGPPTRSRRTFRTT